MAEYDIEFSRRLAQVAAGILKQGLSDPESHRVVAYLSRLSMELALKAFLEGAGLPVSRIRDHSHRLKDLLKEIDQYEVEVEITPGHKHWCAASRLRSVTVSISGYQVPAGMVIEAEDHGASIYPSELRYGSQPKDFPAEALAFAALAIANWVSSNISFARRRAVA